MALASVRLGSLSVSRMILGGNPFAGFSHQNPERDHAMRSYYTTERIKQTLRQAEELGINTFLGRTDRHITRTLLEYRDEGGTIQWIAQTAPELVSILRSIHEATYGGAQAIFIHGGQMDHLIAHNQLDQVAPAIAAIRDAGLPVGLAGHTPAVFAWAEQNVDVDFYMCSYYNPSDRSRTAEHAVGTHEQFLSENRDAMVATITALSKPVIHYKIFAAGRNDPKAAFGYLAQHLRPGDATCIGVFTKDNPNMIRDDIALFEQALGGR
jgi:hypothetical protein